MQTVKFNHENFQKVFQRMLDDGLITKKGFAESLGITPQFAGQIISGSKEPGRDTALMIAEYLNVSLDYLYGRTDCEDIKEIPYKIVRYERKRMVYDSIARIGDYVLKEDTEKAKEQCRRTVTLIEAYERWQKGRK